jgi:hypothetical protein
MATSTGSAEPTRKNRASLASGPGGPWSPQAPRRIRQAYHGDADPAGWTLWRKHLAKRKLRGVSQLFKGRQSPLLWALPASAELEQTERIVELVRRPALADRRTAGLENAVVCWLSRAEVAAHDVAFGLECLAWGGALPEIAEHLGEPTWWQLVNRLVAIAADTTSHGALAGQLLHGELPAVLAYVLPELATCESLASTSRRTLEQATARLASGETPVPGGEFDSLRPLLACWTRWRLINRELDEPVWSEGSPRRYARLVEHAVRLSRADGTPVFSPPDAPPWDRRLLRAALRLADHPKTQRVARLLRSGGKGAADARRPAPSFSIDTAGLAVLRATWRPRSPQLAVDSSGPRLRSELGLGKRTLWSGATDIEVRIDGRPLSARQTWEQVGWESDRKIDYLELELVLADDVKLQRTLALARAEGFLLVADAVLGQFPRKIEYRATLPIADFTRFEPAEETREGLLLTGRRPLARLLPLALPEWRAGAPIGRLRQTDGGALELTQEAFGRALFAPLFVDLKPSRLAREVTWRQLTVGQERQVVPRDAAVGYRVQIGSEQWLVYRSLAEPEVRTVLGQNLKNELLIGRFRSANGKVRTLLEIEA